LIENSFFLSDRQIEFSPTGRIVIVLNNDLFEIQSRMFVTVRQILSDLTCQRSELKHSRRKSGQGMKRTAAYQDMQLLSIDDGHTLSRNIAQARFREKYQTLILRTRSSSLAHLTTVVDIGDSNRFIEANEETERTRSSDTAASTRVISSVAAFTQTLPSVNANGTEANCTEHGHTLASQRVIAAIMRDTTLNAVEKQLRAQAVPAGHCQQPGPATTLKSSSSSNSSFEINRSMHAKLAALAQAHETWLLTQSPLPVDTHGLNMWPRSDATQPKRLGEYDTG